MTFKLEKPNLKEISFLAKDNFEKSYYSNMGQFKLDVDQYKRLDEAGILKFFAARKDGVLVGYAVFVFVKHAHMKQTVIARQDSLYVSPNFRGLGVKLFDYSLQALKKMGAKGVVSSMPGKDRSRFYKRKGFQEVETLYLKTF